MLREWEKEQPGRTDRIFRAMSDVVPSHLLDRNLHRFASLQPNGKVNPEGDRAFDEDELDACGPAAGAEPIGSAPPDRPAQPIRFVSAASGAAPASPPHGDSS